MKSLCIKTNNTNTLEYLLNEFKLLELNNIYFSQNEFKHYKNIIIHYTGKDNNLFINKISSILYFLAIFSIFYLQNLCFPIVTVIGLDQIHLFVAVDGLK